MLGNELKDEVHCAADHLLASAGNRNKSPLKMKVKLPERTPELADVVIVMVR
jgi:hypothetical protein